MCFSSDACEGGALLCRVIVFHEYEDASCWSLLQPAATSRTGVPWQDCVHLRCFVTAKLFPCGQYLCSPVAR